jgi:hypothetical protein
MLGGHLGVEGLEREKAGQLSIFIDWYVLQAVCGGGDDHKGYRIANKWFHRLLFCSELFDNVCLVCRHV